MMLEINHLHKKFKKKTVLDDLNLLIEDNEIFGFVGPNGAGKTTTMRIIAGLLVPDDGEVIWNGKNVTLNADEIRRNLGYMPDFFGAYPNIKTGEYMEYFASLCGFTGNDVVKRCDELLELVNLTDKKDALVDTLSRGMKQRLCMARSLIHDPQLLIFDEPASGLDPRARFEMKEIMKTLCQMGKTVIISSHILPELAQMTKTIGVIENGKIIIKGTVDELLNSNKRAVRININVVSGMDNAVSVLRKMDKVDCMSIMDNICSFEYTGDDNDKAYLIKALVDNDVLISSFIQEKDDIEHVFMELTNKEGV